MFIAKNSDATSWHELLHYFRPFCTEFRKENKWPRMPQNVGFGSNGMDRLHSLQKIPTRLRGPNFCTNSARFAPSFVRQPNGPECTQIVQNAPKRQFRVQWGGLVHFCCEKFRRDFVARTFALVRPVLHRVLKATKRSRMHPNSTKRTRTSV